MHATCQCGGSRAALCCWGLLYRFFPVCGKTESGMEFHINMQTPFLWEGWGTMEGEKENPTIFSTKDRASTLRGSDGMGRMDELSKSRQRELPSIIL